MKRKTMVLLTLAVVMVLAASINSALAYFTTYAEAIGGHVVSIGDTDVNESFSAWTKHVTISNSDPGEPRYVRARAFAGRNYVLTYSGQNWSGPDAEGYYYYDLILMPGQTTSELLIAIQDVPESDAGFNVVVVYETVPALFADDGTPLPPDWSDPVIVREVR